MNTQALINAALDEDIGHGDITTEATVSLSRRGRAVIRAKEPLVLCGLPLVQGVFEEMSRRGGAPIQVHALHKDGDLVQSGEVVFHIDGPLGLLLTGERVALNFLMKLSGIATHVRPYIEAAGPNGPAVVDTRKTTPLLRKWEKYAVSCGGGKNHRFALFDGVMIKDNHIAAVGGLSEAVALARARVHHLVKIQVEVETLEQLREALKTSAEVLLLDNMNDELLQEAVRVARSIRPEVVLEASGNITPERIARIRDFGLDVVSSGGLIHQARWVDLSMRIDAVHDDS